MSPEELQRQLAVGGVSSRVRNEEVQVETCHFCSNTKWNLELNVDRGVFHCWVCKEGGRLDRLLREWLHQRHDIPVRLSGDPTLTTAVIEGLPGCIPAYEHRRAALHLERYRRIPPHTAKHYGLVMCMDKAHELYNRLVLPQWDFWTGEVLGYLGRALGNQRPKYLHTITQWRLTGYRMAEWATPCIIVEGAFDGIAVHRAGFHAAVTSGIPTPERMIEFGSRLPAKTPIVILLDGEAQEAALKIVWSLQTVRHQHQVKQITLPPGRDPADYNPEVLRELINETMCD